MLEAKKQKLRQMAGKDDAFWELFFTEFDKMPLVLQLAILDEVDIAEDEGTPIEEGRLWAMILLGYCEPN